MGFIKVQIVDTPICLMQVSQWTPDQTHGAGNSFIGYVRSFNLGKQVIAIQYDCFHALCEKVFNQIAKEAQSKWGTSANILIIHRHGRLAVGEASVAIHVTTPHRDESYKISRYIIEEIKVRAPIWKKEFYLDGETDWVRGHALCQHRKVDHHDNSRSHTCGREIHSHEARQSSSHD